jgi:hypothetical protein
MVWLVDDLLRLTDLFINDVALSDPLSFFLFVLGAVTVAVTLGIFGLLSVQGLLATLTRDRSL